MIDIRKAHEDDLPALITLWKECMDFHGMRDPFFTRKEDGHEKWAEFVLSNMEDENWIVLLAEDPENVVGYCMASIIKCPPVLTTENQGLVQDMAVTERCQRSGIATALFVRAEQWMLEKGVDRIELNVAIINTRARAFWRKMGFGDFVERLVRDY